MLIKHPVKKALVITAAFIIPAWVAASPSLTIYNDNFAVVRDTLQMPLKKGINQVQYHNISQQLEPDSVVLRPQNKKWQIQILQQNYLSKPINEALLLQHFEGHIIDFEIHRNQTTQIVQGKIVRSGAGSGYNNTPIVEMEGKTRFGLPGRPLFPPLKNDTLLKPTLDWQLLSSKTGEADLQLAYLTRGLSWKADYNVIANDKTEQVQINGWVTFNNASGMPFEDAKIKLMAGDIHKVTEPKLMERQMMRASAADSMSPQVTEKDFDEYHLYSIANPVDLDDGESKQIGFVDANHVTAKTLYVYDGAKINRYYGNNLDRIRNDPGYGTESNSEVWIMREFENSKANNLGIALPKGRVRFYQQDDDGQLEFLGENNINHSPKNETISLYTGNAFDIKGERKRVNYSVNQQDKWARESFEITLKNQKKKPVTVKVVEHLYRWVNWNIEQKSHSFHKTDSQTIEFEVPLKPGQTSVVSYHVHYKW